jgi:hypothetical protein
VVYGNYTYATIVYEINECVPQKDTSSGLYVAWLLFLYHDGIRFSAFESVEFKPFVVPLALYYRFFSNERGDERHFIRALSATRDRFNARDELVLVLHDTTAFSFQ